MYADAAQQEAAERSRVAAQARFEDPITTEIGPLVKFWPAEGYHQEYFERNPGQPYCQFVVAPKVAKFRKHFLSKLKKAG